MNTPTIAPMNTPTNTSTIAPTNTPTNTLTIALTNTPTIAPTQTPTIAPTHTPTIAPTHTPTNAPINPEIANLKARMDTRMARIEALLMAVLNTSGRSLMKGAEFDCQTDH
ncbi:hypothetical protein L211DRAFT_854251 [Terfezia boudieri ATCC MYA-4762]|uniref:Uncharacterized protein n=1 Tax=Terfezia boudieri ATCC MYA-4762 TaxID=1051890 RepID=A0A3N4L5X8_9PEZI|nr:hypothetical protein L211DRAFT_854251 [Terfezia boudieri ATCC MYA-4762]